MAPGFSESLVLPGWPIEHVGTSSLGTASSWSSSEISAFRVSPSHTDMPVGVFKHSYTQLRKPPLVQTVCMCVFTQMCICECICM